MDLALTLTLVGITVVFSALIILAFLIYLLSKAFNRNNKNVNIQNVSVEKQNDVLMNSVNTAENNISTQDEADVQNDDELIAVITAAIMASMKNDPDFKIRVKSLRRIQDTSPVWNVAGKMALLDANVK